MSNNIAEDDILIDDAGNCEDDVDLCTERESTQPTGTSWGKASFLIVNAALGAGLLNFPFAFEEAGGIAAGNTIHFIFVIFALGSLLILGKFAAAKGCKTYQEVVKEYCGVKWSLVCAVVISVYCFVTCITFIIIIGDQFDRAFASFIGPTFCHSWYLNRKFTMTIVCLFLVVPCCYKRIDSLQNLCYAGVVSIVYLIVVMVVEMESGSYTKGEISVWSFDQRLFNVIPTICFGYQCHVSSIPIYSCIRGAKFTSFLKACILSIGTCFLLYTIGANFGYLTFGSMVDGDILLSYDATKPYITVALILLSVKSWTTYPILLYCVREAVADIYLHYKPLSEEETIRKEPARRKIIAIILWSLTLIMAIFTPNINVVVKLLGSLASSFILSFPGLCMFMKAIDDAGIKSWRLLTHDYMYFVIGTIYILVGIFTFGLAFTLGIKDVLNSDSNTPLCR